MTRGKTRISSRTTVLLVPLALLAALASGCGSSPKKSRSSTAATSTSASKLAPVRRPYSPAIDPANFVTTIDNRYLPFEPGTAFHYKGVRGKTPQTDDEVVTHATKRILGVRCTVVRDTVSEHGNPVERTFDWYAQDKQGNVWYMGEDSFELKHGRFAKASDSWKSGVKGAKPGILSRATRDRATNTARSTTRRVRLWTRHTFSHATRSSGCRMALSETHW
jgi:hypothetical protein